jgi:hypothetical protein
MTAYLDNVPVNSDLIDPCENMVTLNGGYACVHASWIDFEDEYDTEGVAIGLWPKDEAATDRYRYLMAVSASPYCGATGCAERPILYGSNDNINWELAPIWQLDKGLAHCSGGTNNNIADPNLTYNPYDDTIYVAINPDNTGNGTGSYYCIISYSGSAWQQTDLVKVFYLWYTYSLSQSVVIKSEYDWHMWCIIHHHVVGGAYSTPQIYHLTSSNKGVSWGNATVCSPHKIFNDYGAYPWHMSARRNPYAPGTVELLITAMPDITGTGTNRLVGGRLVHARTTFDAPTTLTTSLANNILEPVSAFPAITNVASAYDDSTIYRSDMILEPNESGTYDVRLWYSGFSYALNWEDPDLIINDIVHGLGYTTGTIPLAQPDYSVSDNKPSGTYYQHLAHTVTLTRSSDAATDSLTVQYQWDGIDNPSTYTTPITIQTGQLAYRMTWAVGTMILTTDWIYRDYVAKMKETDLAGNPTTTTDLAGNTVESVCGV